MTIGVGTNEWSADGNYAWTADGYPGWSADGYEPVPLAFATSELAAYGVNVGAITYEYSSLVPAGSVITGFVPYLSAAYAGDYIPLLVSQGPAPPPTTLTVPNVVGKFYYDAQQAILDAGFLIAPPVPQLSTTVNPQYVISQSIAAGTTFTQATQVLITVSGFTVIQQPNTPAPVL